MDGTIADFTKSSFRRVKELYNISMTREDAYKPKTAQLVWERMSEEQRSKYGDHRELYGEICNKGFFYKLSPFPGAIDAVKRMYNEGIEIVFLTKVLNWDRSADEKAKWLKKYFSDISYLTIMVDSVHSKAVIDGDVIIDDDYRVLSHITMPIRIMIKQPWNIGKRNFEYIASDIVNAAEIALELKKTKEKVDKKFFLKR